MVLESKSKESSSDKKDKSDLSTFPLQGEFGKTLPKMKDEDTKEVEGGGDSASGEAEVETEFVNEGLKRWEESRQRFTDVAAQSDESPQKVAVPCDVDEIIDLIFSQRWRSPSGSDDGNFPQPVPLPQMVDILVDLWEAEGLDI